MPDEFYIGLRRSIMKPGLPGTELKIFDILNADTEHKAS